MLRPRHPGPALNLFRGARLWGATSPVTEHRHPNDARLHGALAGLQATMHGALAGLQATKQAPIEQLPFSQKSKQQSEQYSVQ
jgi:hypothetical protein